MAVDVEAVFVRARKTAPEDKKYVDVAWHVKLDLAEAATDHEHEFVAVFVIFKVVKDGLESSIRRYDYRRRAFLSCQHTIEGLVKCSAQEQNRAVNERTFVTTYFSKPDTTSFPNFGTLLRDEIRTVCYKRQRKSCF